jgi:hypothetical protein
MSKTFKVESRLGPDWIFEFCLLGFVYNLGFAILDFNKSKNIPRSKSALGITKAWLFGSGTFFFLTFCLK